jgi:hypothetical protein
MIAMILALIGEALLAGLTAGLAAFLSALFI